VVISSGRDGDRSAWNHEVEWHGVLLKQGRLAV